MVSVVFVKANAAYERNAGCIIESNARGVMANIRKRMPEILKKANIYVGDEIVRWRVAEALAEQLQDSGTGGVPAIFRNMSLRREAEACFGELHLPREPDRHSAVIAVADEKVIERNVACLVHEKRGLALSFAFSMWYGSALVLTSASPSWKEAKPGSYTSVEYVRV